MDYEQIHLRINGRVQGVGFRVAAVKEAKRLSIGGWVKNTPEGDIELMGEGSHANIESLCRWCNKGPTLAEVTELKVLSRSPIQAPS